MAATPSTEIPDRKRLDQAKWADRLMVLLLTGVGLCWLAKLLLEHGTADWVLIIGLIALLLGVVTAGGVAACGGAWALAICARARSEATQSRSPSRQHHRLVRFLCLCAVVLLAPLLLRQGRVPLGSPAPANVYATHPFFGDEGEYAIRRDGTNVFGLFRDWFDQPEFIYAFADGQRFLCLYDGDTAYLVFVTDLNTQRAAGNPVAGWPPTGLDREYVARYAARVTNITNGSTRLPTWPEVKEVADYLNRLPGGNFYEQYLAKIDLGLFQISMRSQHSLISVLHTNHPSLWPEK